jgi:hypothetical protein
VLIATLVLLGLAVDSAFFVVLGLVSVGALASLAPWWATRSTRIADGRTPASVEVDLDEWAPSSGPEGRR